MKTQPVATITENSISIYMNGVLYPPIDRSHTNFEKIKSAIKIKDWSVIPKLIDVSSTIKKYLSKQSNVRLENGVLYYKDSPMNNLITKRIMCLLEEGFDFQPLLNFIENLHQNPSVRAVNELYQFLEHFALPITEDGCFLAYKAVKNNYKDIYSGTFDNSVGKKPSIDRNLVDEDKNNHCSKGLHVGAIAYVTQYGAFGNGITSDGNRLMIVKVNPADAVSVPGDHNCTKLRVCSYEVIGEIKDIKNILDRAVYTSTGGSLEPIHFDDEVDIDNWDDDNSDIDYTDGYIDGSNDRDLGVPFETPDGSDEYVDGYTYAYHNNN